MADLLQSLMIGVALAFGLWAYIFGEKDHKKLNKLEEMIDKLDKQVGELIGACNNNTKHIDKLVLASTDTMKIVAEHIDEIKELKKRR